LAEHREKSPRENYLAMLKYGMRLPDEGIGQDHGHHLFWKGR